jgi:hypothetical protein
MVFNIFSRDLRQSQSTARRLHRRQLRIELLEDRTVLAVGIGASYEGSRLNVDSFSKPPDTMGAVGPAHFVELINGRYSVYSKTTGLELQTYDLNSFWTVKAGLTGADVSSSFDPRIVFDHASSRWFAIAVDHRDEVTSNLQIAVSASSDPTGTWKGFSILADSNGATGGIYWGDFPTLGVDADGVYISMNMALAFTNTISFVTIISIPKSGLLLSTPTIANLTRFDLESLSNRGAALQPAVDYGSSDGRAAILATDADVFSVLNRTNILNAAGPGPATLSITENINVATTSQPPTADQPH